MYFDYIDMTWKLMIIFCIPLVIMMYYKDRLEQRRSLQEQIYMQIEAAKNEQISAIIPDVRYDDSGYIIMDMPEERRALFHELLKSFEGYATLKGYEISFSIDNSILKKVRFKFTVRSQGVEVSQEKIKSDIMEFMQKVERGEQLGDIPIIIPREEHDMVLTKLTNRINFLQINYNLANTAVKYYENLLNNIPTLVGQPTVNIDFGSSSVNSKQINGGDIGMSSYSAVNSNGIIQGEDIKNISQKVSIDNGVNIAKSFNQKLQQIDELTKFIEELRDYQSKDEVKKQEAIRNLENIEEEIKNEEEPNVTLIDKWFGRVDTALKSIGIGRELIDKTQNLYQTFQLNELLDKAKEFLE